MICYNCRTVRHLRPETKNTVALSRVWWWAQNWAQSPPDPSATNLRVSRFPPPCTFHGLGEAAQFPELPACLIVGQRGRLT